MIEATIKGFEEKGIFKKGEYGPDNFSIAPKVYKDLLAYKAKADDLMKSAPADMDANSTALMKKAKQFYAGFDFLDAYRFAAASVGKQ